MSDRISECTKYIGLHEVRDNAKLQSLLGINPASTAWCAAFANAIENKCGGKGTGSLAARSFTRYGTKVDSIDNAVRGDILVFKRGKSSWQGHVTYFIRADKSSGQVLCLGGNQNDSVCYRLYPLSSLLAIRRP